MKKNKSKGFTLIELLVVVAIIGILASVGVVAYNGYTASAQRGAAGSNHNSVAKWISNEFQKCAIGEVDAMDENLICVDENGVAAGAAEVAEATILSQRADGARMNNPYGGALAVQDTGTAAPGLQGCDRNNAGQIVVTVVEDDVVVTTCTAARDGETLNRLEDVIVLN
jgi:type IV pilus assembly protein PilA